MGLPTSYIPTYIYIFTHQSVLYAFARRLGSKATVAAGAGTLHVENKNMVFDRNLLPSVIFDRTRMQISINYRSDFV